MDGAMMNKPGADQGNGGMQGLPPIAVRSRRVQTVVNCQVPDKVPFIPTVGNFYATGYGITIEAAMKDLKLMIPVMDKFLPKYDPDLVYSPLFFPIKPMEFAGYKNARWPGEYHQLPPDTPYQYLDQEYLPDDGYEDYLKDPSAFLMKNLLAKRFKAFEGLQFLDIPTLCTQAIYTLAPLAAPPVKQALENMLKTADLVMESLQDAVALDMHIIGKGYPVFGGLTVLQPFDDFADNVRGLLATTMDLLEDPELVNEAVTRWGDVTIPATVANARRQHAQYAFIPLHGGMDSFMSPDNYEKYYWPHLKRLIMALVAADVTPICVCEGTYNTRLEVLTDVPKGKVMYMFEDVDLKRAKDILSGTACFGGGMPTQLLMEGSSVQAVREQVKRCLDICAPGGGFFMTNSISLDNVEHEFLEAWVEALDMYGKY